MPYFTHHKHRVTEPIMRYLLLTSRSTNTIQYFLLQKMTDIEENILLYCTTVIIQFVGAYNSQ